MRNRHLVPVISLRADCRSKTLVEIGFGSVVFVKTLKIDRTVYTRMLLALAEIPHHRFGFLFTHGNQSFRYVKRPIIGYSNLVIQSNAAKQHYLRLSRSMEGKDKIQTIGKNKNNNKVFWKSKSVCLRVQKGQTRR